MREFFSRFRPQADTIEMHNAESIISASDIRHIDHENTKHHNRGATPNSIAQTTPTQGFDSDEEMIHRDAQAGVQKIEAVTQVWSKKHMIAAYVMIWIISFVSSLEQGMGPNLTTYVTSDFKLHSLTSATGVMSSIIGGLTKLPLAKLIDVWGRPQGYMVMVACSTLGLVLMAVCNGVEVYAAAQVFYWIGHFGTQYVFNIFVADTSRLRNRGLMFALMASPFIITSWIAGPLATAYLGIEVVNGEKVVAGVGWRWAYGTFSIILPIVSFPLFALFEWNYRKALRLGIMVPDKTSRSFGQSLKHYLVEFDVVGLLLLVTGFALLLLPMNIYSYQPHGFRSPMMICMIVFGVACFIGFAIWERFGAPVTLLPFDLMRDRTIIGSNLLAAVIFFGFYMWNGMFPSFLQVVSNLSFTEATYVSNIYSVGSCLWAFVAGLMIHRSGRFKCQALYFGVPVTILGAGLMIHFRQPGIKIGYIVMCQIFIAFGGGTLIITEQMAVMAATTHQYVAVMIAILDMFSSVGGAIGSTVSTAIWTGTFRNNLLRFLPSSEISNVDNIYGDIKEQLKYAPGSPGRLAIQAAYGETQKWQLVVAVATLSLMIPCVIVWRNYQLKDHKQVLGRVV